MKAELTEAESIEFNYKTGTIIATDIAKDYLGTCATHYKQKQDNYRYNVCKKAEEANQKAFDVISRDIDAHVLPELKQFVEMNMHLIYDTVALSVENQKRVHGLILKLKKEENEESLSKA